MESRACVVSMLTMLSIGSGCVSDGGELGAPVALGQDIPDIVARPSPDETADDLTNDLAGVAASSSSDTVVVRGERALYVSRDGGATFRGLRDHYTSDLSVGADGTIMGVASVPDREMAQLLIVRADGSRFHGPIPVDRLMDLQAAAGRLLLLGERELAVSLDYGRSWQLQELERTGRWGAQWLQVDEDGRIQYTHVSGSIDCDGGSQREFGRLGHARFRPLGWRPDTDTPVLGPGGWAYTTEYGGCVRDDEFPEGDQPTHWCAYGPRGQVVPGPKVTVSGSEETATVATNGRSTYLSLNGELFRARRGAIRKVADIPLGQNGWLNDLAVDRIGRAWAVINGQLWRWSKPRGWRRHPVTVSAWLSP